MSRCLSLLSGRGPCRSMFVPDLFHVCSLVRDNYAEARSESRKRLNYLPAASVHCAKIDILTQRLIKEGPFFCIASSLPFSRFTPIAYTLPAKWHCCIIIIIIIIIIVINIIFGLDCSDHVHPSILSQHAYPFSYMSWVAIRKWLPPAMLSCHPLVTMSKSEKMFFIIVSPSLLTDQFKQANIR